MLKNFRKSFAALVAGLALAIVPVLAPVAVSAADIGGNLKCGSNLDASGTGCDSNVTSGSSNLNNVITDIVNIFSVIVGIVSVIMIIYGGFRYVTSGGDSGNVSSAKNTIIYAVIGLVVVALAQFIVQFVLDKVTTIGQ
ncbi:MAG TPA: pilin [Candidatus Saccharimonadales bacterium]|nr:pilin [Candidatus Saccharimonadales bacterium]